MLFLMASILSTIAELFAYSNQKISALEQGLVISVIGVSVVFSGLTLLFLALKFFLFILENRKTQVKTGGLIIEKKGRGAISGEVVAAISMAIHQNQEQFHDLEETILTLNRIKRPYSPWSSKIQLLRKPVR